MHQALLFRQLSDDVTYFAHTEPPSEEAAEELAARGIRVVEGTVVSLETADDRLTGVRLADGTVVALQALVITPWMVARASFLADLGLRPVAHPSGLGEHVPTDPTGRTDALGPGRRFGGRRRLRRGAQINADLVAAETRSATDAYRRSSATLS